MERQYDEMNQEFNVINFEAHQLERQGSWTEDDSQDSKRFYCVMKRHDLRL
jgi:hypothetical protein